MSDGEPTEFGDVVDFDLATGEDDKRWIVLFPEDYDNFARDVEGNIAVLVDIKQTGELLRLTAQSLAELSHRDAVGDDVIRDMIDELEEVLGDE